MSIYRRTGTDILWMRFTIPGYPRVRESTGTSDSKEAERVEIKRKAEVLNQPAALKGKTWNNAVMKWAEHKDPSYTELLGIQKFNQFFPDRMLATITSEMVESALKKFCKTAGTFNRHRARVLGILELSDVATKLPMRKVKEKERDNARDVIWTMAPDGAITYVSRAVEAVRGFTPAEAMLQSIEEILTPNSQRVPATVVAIDIRHRPLQVDQ